MLAIDESSSKRLVVVVVAMLEKVGGLCASE